MSLNALFTMKDYNGNERNLKLVPDLGFMDTILIGTHPDPKGFAHTL